MRTVLWLLLGGLLLVTWLAAPWAAVPWIALCWLAAPLVSWLALAITRRRIRTELTGPGTAEKGKPFSVAASVDSAVPMGRACLVTDVENLATGEKRRQRLTMERGRGEWAMTSGLCGCMQLRGTKLVVWDIFGVLPLAVPCHVHALICVMPDTFPVETDPVLALSSRTDCDEYAPDVKGNDPTEIFQLREYAPGDSLRQIHWKLSGKTGRYMVREGSKPVDHRLLPILNGRIEGANPEKVFYFLAPDDSMRGFRIHSGDVALVVPAQSPIDGAVMLVEYGAHRALRKIKKLDSFQVLLQSYDREYNAETMAISDVTFLGRCVRLEINL